MLVDGQEQNANPHLLPIPDSIASFFGDLFSSIKEEFLAQPKPRVTRVVPRTQGEDTTIRDAYHLLQGANNMRSYSVGSIAVPATGSHSYNCTDSSSIGMLHERRSIVYVLVNPGARTS